MEDHTPSILGLPRLLSTDFKYVSKEHRGRVIFIIAQSLMSFLCISLQLSNVPHPFIAILMTLCGFTWILSFIALLSWKGGIRSPQGYFHTGGDERLRNSITSLSIISVAGWCVVAFLLDWNQLNFDRTFPLKPSHFSSGDLLLASISVAAYVGMLSWLFRKNGEITASEAQVAYQGRGVFLGLGFESASRDDPTLNKSVEIEMWQNFFSSSIAQEFGISRQLTEIRFEVSCYRYGALVKVKDPFFGDRGIDWGVNWNNDSWSDEYRSFENRWVEWAKTEHPLIDARRGGTDNEIRKRLIGPNADEVFYLLKKTSELL